MSTKRCANFFVLSLLIAGSVEAAPLYKWRDAKGVTHYSVKAPSKDAKPVELPPIMRGEVKLARQKLISCDRHGGINCAAGADSDGSVVCYDGFRDASARYGFSCSSPKLEVTDISEIDLEGGFKVFVRNSKSVVAKDPKLTFKTTDGRTVELSGPQQIESFGLAEFQYKFDPNTKVQVKPTLAQLSLSCANCAA